jgi:hypothetical protein
VLSGKPTTFSNGSACGEEGFRQRWKQYAITGHGGNISLKNGDRSDYQVSILEVAGSGSNPDDILKMESRWKEKLQSREMGLNKNSTGLGGLRRIEIRRLLSIRDIAARQIQTMRRIRPRQAQPSRRQFRQFHVGVPIAQSIGPGSIPPRKSPRKCFL